jgi:HlyD family secretion protein
MSSTAITSPLPDDPLPAHQAEARRLMRWAVLVLLGALAPTGAWLALAPLSSAVVAPAHVKVDLNRRPVQHAEGGTVREVLVRDGQRVKQGEPLLVLGDVAVDAEVKRVSHRLMAERASVARLEAELASAGAVTFGAEVLAAAKADERVAAQVARERALFAARREALHGQVALLRGQREKVQGEIKALEAQIRQAAQSLAFQRTELETNRNLVRDGFISATRVAQLEATVADYGVKVEERRSEHARAEQRLTDIDLRISTLEGDYRQQASEALRLTSARVAEIEQELRKSTDASARQIIMAPVAGEVIELKHTAPGAVIAPRETIAEIVPADPRLVTEARIRPEDINRVQRGQPAEIRFTAYTYRSTPLVKGSVMYISADRLLDRSTNLPYFAVLIEADAASMASAGDPKLLAGMPAEVYIDGDKRTPLEYLIEPVTQVLRRGARER